MFFFVCYISCSSSSKKEKERLANTKKREGYRFTTNTSRTPSLHVDDYVNKEKQQSMHKGKLKNR
jgi:hypothetical protein